MTPAERRAALLAALVEERFPRAAIEAEALSDLVDHDLIRMAKAQQAWVETDSPWSWDSEAERDERRQTLVEAAEGLRTAS